MKKNFLVLAVMLAAVMFTCCKQDNCRRCEKYDGHILLGGQLVDEEWFCEPQEATDWRSEQEAKGFYVECPGEPNYHCSYCK